MPANTFFKEEETLWIKRFLALSLFALMAAPLAADEDSTVKDMTTGNEDRVTLPVPPGSKLVIHAEKGIDFDFGDGPFYSLPVASFLTTWSPQEAVAWYKERLPNFTILAKPDQRNFQILKEAPEGMTIDGPESYRIPNIRIHPTDARTATHLEGAQAMLQVYYEPKE